MNHNEQYPMAKLKMLPVCCFGEAQIESLSSFFVRLANLHRVPVKALYRYCFPDRCDTRLNTRHFTHQAASFFNGYRDDAVDTVDRLSELLCFDVSPLTLLPWHFYFDSMAKGIFVNHKRWCPLCLQENKIPHEKLIWNLKEYKVCSTHGVLLVDRCFHCGSHQPVISKSNIIGFCAHCGSDLGEVTNLYYDEDCRSRQVEKLIGLAISSPALWKDFSIENPVDNLKRQLGISSCHALEKFLGFGERTISQWVNGRYKPTLTAFLDIIEVLKVDSHDFIKNNFFVNSEDVVPREYSSIARSEKGEVKKKVQRYLGKLSCFQMREIPVKKIARRLDVGISYLNYNFPEEIKKIKFNNKCARVLKNIARVTYLRKLIFEAVTILDVNDIYPSHNRVMAIVNKNKKGFAITHFSILWKNELSELEFNKNN